MENQDLGLAQKRVSKRQLSQVNAAIGGTGPDYGARRINNHLLKHQPDMIFIEYKVNNGGAFEGRAFEGLIPQIWRHNPDTEICIVNTIAKWMLEEMGQGKQTSSGRLIESVANHYRIPLFQGEASAPTFRRGDFFADSGTVYRCSNEYRDEVAQSG